ncbi:hypothetical protein [Roseibium sp. MB-4]
MSRGRPPKDTLTPDMFLDWIPPKVAVGFEPNAIQGDRLASRISRAVAKALKECDRTREEIANTMSDRLGHKVSVTTLDAYASEAKLDNNITVERFIALVGATGKTELLGFLADDFDLKVVPAKYENVITLALIEDHEKQVSNFKKSLQAKAWRSR